MADVNIIRLGNIARSLKDNEEFKIFTEAMRVETYKGWASTQPEQSKEREEFYYLLLAIEKLNAKLSSMEQSGRMEQSRLDAEDAKAKKVDAKPEGEAGCLKKPPLIL